MRQTFASVHNVQILPYALSSETSTGQLHGDGVTSRLTSGELPDVTVETIDNLFFRQGIKLDLIKADLEGHDLKMLMGASQTISQHAPRIAITTYHESEHAQAMVDYLGALNRAYKFRVKGIDAAAGAPVMLHAWT
jgi:hypothetical protein